MRNRGGKVVQCPNCGHSWTAHSSYIARQERMCVEQLENGYSLRIQYTDQNMLYYAQAYEGDLFVCQHHGQHAISLCKQSITRRIRELPVHTKAEVSNPPAFM